MAEYRAARLTEGLTMEDGTVYRANRSGRITVDNPRHVAAIEGNAAMRDGHIHAISGTGAVGGAYRDCPTPGCRFRGYGWQARCPRCDAELTAAV